MPLKDPLLIDWHKVYDTSLKALKALDIFPSDNFLPEGIRKQILRGLAQEIKDTIMEPEP